MTDFLITREDLQELLANPAPARRAELAARIALAFKSDGLPSELKQQAHAILEVIVEDTEQLVRQTLVNILKDCPELPRGVALKMLEDTNAIALPVLRACLVLTDEDLLTQVQAKDPERQTAIAGRPVVSAPVASALVQHGNRTVHAVLAANSGADVSESDLASLLRQHYEDEQIKQRLTYRPNLPPVFAEKLVHAVAQHLQEYLINTGSIRPEIALKLMTQAREKMTLRASKPTPSEREVGQLVRHLADHDRLTDSLILRALCTGDRRFFDHALATRARLDVAAVRRVLRQNGREGLQAICQKAGLPLAWLGVLFTALELHQHTATLCDDEDSERLSRRVMERLLTLEPKLEAETLDHLLEKLTVLPAASAHV